MVLMVASIWTGPYIGALGLLGCLLWERREVNYMCMLIMLYLTISSICG
jgi:hypothetical protein